MLSKPIIIKDFQTGIGDSPHTGFDMRNIDIWSEKGVAKVAYVPIKESGTTVTDLIKWFVVNSANGDIYALGDTGKLYRSTDDGDSWAAVSGASTTNAHGNGLGIWKSYLFVARDTNLDVMKLSDDSWDLGWQTLNSDTSWHPILATRDGRLTIGNGQYIAQITENTAFDPDSGATYTWSADSLNLPPNIKIKCFTELGKFLMIGTWAGTSLGDLLVADIFPWNLDEHPASYEDVISLEESGINALLTSGNVMIIQAGINGTLYYSYGTTALPLKEINHIDWTSGVGMSCYPDSLIKTQNKFLIGFTGTPGGVYAYKNQVLNLDNVISELVTTATIGALQALGTGTFLVGWKNGSTYGIDRFINTNRYSVYGDAYIDSPFYVVGVRSRQETADSIEFQFSRPMTTGCGVRLKFRRDVTSSFTTVGTADFSTHASSLTVTLPANGLTDLDGVQFRIEMIGSSEGTGTPYLRQITIL